MNVRIAYQLYSARDLAEKDFCGLLKALRALGFDGVEFAGFFGTPAEQLRDVLQNHSLEAVASHIPFEKLQEDLGGIIDYHKKIGCKRIVIPYLDETERPGAKGFAKAICKIAHIGKALLDHGMELYYHNHDFEFIRLSEIYGLDFLYEAVPPSFLRCEIDSCWVKYAGIDPSNYLKKYAGRADIVHIKDYKADGNETSPYLLIGKNDSKTDKGTFRFTPFGRGVQNHAELIQAALQAGCQWLIVEQDENYDINPLENAKMSLEAIKKLLF